MKIKRVYDEVEESDGFRILIDRLWPRGLSKEKASIDEWDKEIAPSTELRKWFNHEPEKFEEFKQKYKMELLDKEANLNHLRALSEKQEITLLYGAKDAHLNQAVVLLEVLQMKD